MKNKAANSTDILCKEDELRSEGFSSYIDSIFVQRLRGISFLGVLDYVYKLDPISNRYDHTICVAHLALELSRQIELKDDMRRAFVIANILHDIGHAAFSHNSEPFLREHFSLYHQGLLSAIFRHTNRFTANGISLTHILRSEKDSVSECVPDLILQSRRARQPLQTLFHGPLNCDKIEGNHRTMLHLQRDSIEPSTMLQLFSISDENVCVNRDNLGLVVAFWEAERNVYWKDIYTPSVFAAEAMITRALENCFKEPSEIEEFLFYTDDEVFEHASQSRPASRLMNRVRNNALFLSLREEQPELLNSYEERFRNHRFDKSIRAEIEAEIAEILNIAPSDAISHFSRRKYFDSQLHDLYQMNLFDPDPQTIPLERVEQAFLNSKRAADFFDIFYSDTNEG
ncbi:MAG: hypothetical protein CEE38_13730 [Planctomycetes bacterium B3_Pla]|nr:MAG: hypothetical protein CEE38_13730 [Planctomycetes bacterium B3_Pla]